MTLTSLHTERTRLRRYPTWLFMVCFGIAYWMDRQDSPLSLLVLFVGIAISIGHSALELRYDRHVRQAAPQLIEHILAAPTTTPLRVRRSATAIVGNLFQLGIAAWIGQAIPTAIADLSSRGAESPTYVVTTALMLAAFCALVLIALVLAWSGLRQLFRTITGRALLEIDSAGIRIGYLDLTVAWTEIDGVYCFNRDRLVPGLALHLIDPAATMGRSTRSRLLRRIRLRLVTRSDSWLLIPDSSLREPLVEVLGAAISHHRAATDPACRTDM